MILKTTQLFQFTREVVVQAKVAKRSGWSGSVFGGGRDRVRACAAEGRAGSGGGVMRVGGDACFVEQQASDGGGGGGGKVNKAFDSVENPKRQASGRSDSVRLVEA